MTRPHRVARHATAAVRTCVLCCAVWSTAARATTVALLPLTHGEVPADDGFEAELRAVIASAPGVDLQTQAQTATHLATAKILGVSCDAAATDCIAQLGEVAAVQSAIGGRVSMVGSEQTVDVQLVDVAKHTLVRSATMVVPPAADASARAQMLKVLAIKLLSPTAERGYLVISVNMDDATVLVDGLPASRGRVPVRPGKHDVYISSPHALEAFAQTYDVKMLQEIVVQVTLELDTHSFEAPAADPAGADTVDDVPSDRTSVAVFLPDSDDPGLAAVLLDAMAQSVGALEGVGVVVVPQVPAAPEGLSCNATCYFASTLAHHAVVGFFARVYDIGGRRHVEFTRVDELDQAQTYRTEVGLYDVDLEPALAAALRELFHDRDTVGTTTRPLRRRLQLPSLVPTIPFAVAGLGAVVAVTGGVIWLVAGRELPELAAVGVSVAAVGGATAVVGGALGVVALPFVVWE